jgi:hypothetical protein
VLLTAIRKEGKRVSPAIVTIDPLSDANRMAATQQKAELNKQGFIPRREVQRAAGADDPAAWDRMLIVDTAMEQLASLAILSKRIVLLRC